MTDKTKPPCQQMKHAIGNPRVFILIGIVALQSGMTGCKPDTSGVAASDPVASDAVASDSAKAGGDYHGEIDVSLVLARGFESSMGGGMGFAGGGYRYDLKVEIGNPNLTPFHFDSIDVFFTDGLGHRFNSPMALSSETITFTKKGISTYFHYAGVEAGDVGDGKRGVPTDEDHSPDEVELKGHKAVSFPASIGASLPPTICGHPPTVINATLMLAGKPVSNIYRAALPPLMKIPDEFKARNEDDRYRVRLLPPSFLPARSDVFDQAAVSKALEVARKTSPEAALKGVTPELMSITTFTSQKKRLFPGGWHYDFWSPSGAFSLARVDPSVVSERSREEKPLHLFDKGVLETCAIDCDVVAMMIEEVETENPGDKSSGFNLTPAMVNGKQRPVWEVGYKIGGKQVCIFADSGEIAYRAGETLEPFSNVIWNP